MKTVLHVALVAPGMYSSAPFEQAFLNNGFHSYYLFDWQLKMFELQSKEKMQDLLIQEADRLKPDLIFCQVQSGDMVELATFKRLSEISFTVNYTLDIRSKEKSEWLYDLAGVIGAVFLSNQNDVDECKKRGYANAMTLQSSADMDTYEELADIPRRSTAVFIGNNTAITPLEFPKAQERVEMVSLLKERFPEQFEVYGMGWDSRFLMQKEEVEVYQSAQVAICHNQFEAPLYTSDRLWRAMACGSFCLTKHFPGIHLMFTRGVHLDWWENFDELTAKLSFYLSQPEATRTIARNGMNHVRMNHNWTVRVAQLLDFIKPKKKQDKAPCLEAHTIEGKIPEPADQELDGKVCDCGKLRAKWEECGCANKQWQLRLYENI